MAAGVNNGTFGLSGLSTTNMNGTITSSGTSYTLTSANSML